MKVSKLISFLALVALLCPAWPAVAAEEDSITPAPNRAAESPDGTESAQRADERERIREQARRRMRRDAADADTAYLRVYRVHSMGFNEAVSMAHAQCDPAIPVICRPRGSFPTERYFEFEADLETHKQIEAMLAELDVPPPNLLYEVLILKAEQQEGTEPIELPALSESADKALADIAGFLPYNRFSILGRAGLRVTREGSIFIGDPPQYRVHIALDQGAAARKIIHVREFGLQVWQPNPEDTATGDWRRAIATSFEIRPGETVVVGTSSLNGGSQAITVLFTAGR